MELIHIKTRTHSSRMCTARVLTVSHSIPSIQWEGGLHPGGSAFRGWGLPPGASASRRCLHPRGLHPGEGGWSAWGGCKDPPVDRQHL